jgi:hypothetical protein
MFKDFNRDRNSHKSRTKIKFKGNTPVRQTEQDGDGWYWKISGRELRPGKK